jgi:hypothetical protein
MMNSMTAKEADGSSPTPNVEDVSMKGTSLGVTGVLDQPISNWFTLRGTAGYEPFKATGTATFLSCSGTTNCTAEMGYLSIGGYARFEIYRANALMIWGGLGGDMKYPISKSTSALKSDDLKLTATYGGAIGADYFISNKNFIPFSIEQQIFMPSDTVKANALVVRVGYGHAL